jgi:hypothetical protein
MAERLKYIDIKCESVMSLKKLWIAKFTWDIQRKMMDHQNLCMAVKRTKRKEK